MSIYAWEGRTVRGEIQKGELEADSESFVRLVLRRQGITPTKVRAKAKDISDYLSFLKQKVTSKDMMVFTRQFSTMIGAGMPLVQSLEAISSQQENKTFKKILQDVEREVESGATFSDALKKHPETFDDLFVNLVSAGEAGGIMDTVLNRLCSYIEKAEKLKKQVKGALVYPASIVGIAVVVIIVMMVFVIPTFQKMFAEFGQALPAPTAAVIGISNFFKSNIIYILIAFFVLSYIFRYTYKNERGRAIIDDFILKTPVFGPLIRKVAVARFTRTMGTMITSGVPILDGLELTSKTAGNKTIEKAVLEAKKSISEGKTMSEPLKESGVFPPMVIQMISAGEAIGAMDEMLNKIADFYDEEVDAAVAALTSLLEPMLMLFLGVVIGGLVIAMYLPIFTMAGGIG
ncbi:MAG: type II secretion system F family protein [Thermodesulfobacteriota bacterium]|nr:type II secretion system F family protein [Thermodesulfobacteriota bacterium]